MVQKIVIICGPTGSGKTKIAVELASRFNGEIINADSQQVYRGLDIGTAKASHEDMKGIAHHLIDIVAPDAHFEAHSFALLADKAIEETVSKKKLPFIVGGTGMYIKLLLHGLCEAPPQDPKIREMLHDRIEKEGIESLYEQLKLLDPETAEIISKNDRTRIVRALEILEISGKTASQFYREHNHEEKRYEALKIGISIPKEELYKRIEERIDAMLSKGWIEETKGLLKRYNPDSKGFMAIGYKEIISYLNGGLPYNDMVKLIKLNSRHYAKRQMTWFRADKEISWHSPLEVEEIAKEIECYI